MFFILVGVRKITFYIWSQPSYKPIISVESWKELWLTLIWEKNVVWRSQFTHSNFGFVGFTYYMVYNICFCCKKEALLLFGDTSSILLNYYLYTYSGFLSLIVRLFSFLYLIRSKNRIPSSRHFAVDFAIWCSAQCVGS